MLAKFFIFLTLSCALLQAADKPKEQDVEMLAKTVTKDGDVAHAIGNVVVYSPQYLITADEAYYNYVTGDLELFGNITMLEGVNYASRSGHSKLNLKTKKGTSDPLFFFDESSSVWLKCENAVLDAETYITQKSIVSSCNTQDPDWKIVFTTGEFNKESKWMHLYNPVFYAGDVPVFYLPYFAFSTDRTRRTGLLRPDFGMSSSEGLYYMQPIYFAPAVDWDLELRPQIRTNRGEGLHATYRFVDTAYSKGEITTGYFKEQSHYVDENDAHYGFHLQYDRSALLSTQYSQIQEDGLWVDIHYLNDIDYYNTKDNEDTVYDKLAVSRLNYYIKQEQDYFGFYTKYYIDTSKSSNKDTLQELPTIQYHRFTSPIFWDNLLYSVDYQGKNYTREERGPNTPSAVGAIQNEVRTPLTFYTSFFEDYLHVSASENIYMTYVTYSGETDGSYLQHYSNYHRFNLFTDLSKSYDTFFHTMYFGLEHTVPSYSKTEGTQYKATFMNAVTSEDMIPLDLEEKNTAFQFKQFFYDMDGEKKLSHSIKQAYYYDKEYHYGDLENDVKYYINGHLYVGDTVHYSHHYDQLSRNQISVTYQEPIYQVSLRHTYVDRTYEHNTEDKDYSYVTLYGETSYWEHFTLFSAINYDVEDDLFKSWSLGFKKVKKCWDYSLVYRDSNTPKQTTSTNGIDSVNKRGVMLMFNLYPMGSFSYDFKTESEQKQ
ncbi:LPS-assembly protein LptD [Sulfurospirillum cavolei]|uniref:LPS-assembly protein LptD n=1 Tax=Sulfurospirillum cavolei TaxID=366522 RepID=UPI000764A79B|nr:LPS-assembly protein LptD [Sulfurospirillum cavolei]